MRACAQVFICQTPGIWGALPKGFKSLWEVSMDIFFTYNVSSSAFSFKPGRPAISFHSHSTEFLEKILFPVIFVSRFGRENLLSS